MFFSIRLACHVTKLKISHIDLTTCEICCTLLILASSQYQFDTINRKKETKMYIDTEKKITISMFVYNV